VETLGTFQDQFHLKKNAYIFYFIVLGTSFKKTSYQYIT